MRRILIFALLSFIWTSLSANDSAREYFKFAKFSYDAHDYSKALEFINKAIEVEPEYLNGLILRAEINLKLKSYHATLRDVNQCLKINDQSTSMQGQIYALRGVAYYHMEEYDKALSDLNQSLEIDSDHEMAHFYLGVMALNEKSYFPALEHFDEAIKSNSNNAEYFYFRAKAKIDNFHPIANTPTFDHIISDIERAIALNPGDFRAYRLRCDMLKLNEKNAREMYIEELSRTIELFPEQAEFYAQRGMARILEYEFADALTDLDKAIAFNGANGLTLRNRALCHHNLSNYPAAIKDYSNSLDLLIVQFQDNQTKSTRKMLAETLVMRGRTYQQLGNSDEACTDFYNAAKLGSKTGLNNYRRNCNIYN